MVMKFATVLGLCVGTGIKILCITYFIAVHTFEMYDMYLGR